LEIIKASHATDLPASWDSLAVDYFQTIEFLDHAEKYNPCSQRYYALYDQGMLITGLIMYTLRLDLFTYLSISSPFRMHIVGIPCSVSSSGVVGNEAHLTTILEYLKGEQKGLILVLNLGSETDLKGFACARTLPTVVLENNFESWDDYLNSLRADYRRRIKRLSRPFTGINMKHGDCSGFDKPMYDQYLAVLKRSKGKLETLSLDFFQNLPSSFYLSTFSDQDKVIGWFITTVFREKHYFFMGGIDYSLNRQCNTYFNVLMEVLREGFGRRASRIDLGQTAEVPKLRMGGQIVEKYMLGYHSNRIFSLLLVAGKGLLGYSAIFQQPRVFKA